MSGLKSKISIGAHPFLYPEPVLLVGSYDRNDKANVMLAAWAGMCSSAPPSLMVAVRPERWSHDAIIGRKAFTIGIASESMLVAADYTGLVSGRKGDKFAAAGFTPIRAEKVDAPYVAECPVVLECALTRHLTVGVHTLMFADILDIKADEDCLGPGGKPDINKMSALLYEGGQNAYYGVGRRLGDAFSAGKALMK